MIRRRVTRIIALRMLVLGVSFAAVLLVTPETVSAVDIARSILIGHAVFFVLGSVLSWRNPSGGLIPFLLLAGDLLAVGAVGCFLRGGNDLQISFLTAYLVSTLVAVVGHSGRAALSGTLAGGMVLGTMAGGMVLGLGTAVLSDPTHGPPGWPVLLGQAAFLACAAAETAVMTGWINGDIRQRLVNAERMTLVGQTLAGVAHELSNPLAALTGYMDLLKARNLGPEAAQLVDKGRDQAARAARIVCSLRQFIRKQKQEIVSLPLETLITPVVELFAYQARIQGIEVRTDVDPGLPKVAVDAQGIQQILVNLHQNAFHALKDSTEAKRLRIRVYRQDRVVCVSYQDTGHGVPDPIRPRIFEPFFTTKDGETGTGLGLVISRGIARSHGGDLVLEPSAGSGACFTLSLPPCPQESVLVAAAEKSRLPPRVSVGAAVLVVDDEEPVRETLVGLLAERGYEVDAASGVTDAQARLATRTYDAILLDIRMPGISGLDFYRTLRAVAPALADRVVLMTGDLLNDEIRETADAKRTRVLLKPFNTEEVVEALEESVRETVNRRAAGARPEAAVLL
jgi:signal transduction histidine kinase/ActR/RegA family two-component response regulator